MPFHHLLQELCTSSAHLSCCRFLQQLRKDHVGVQAPERRRRFSSLDDALQRLLPYHVFQGAPPSREEFSQGKDPRSLLLPSPSSRLSRARSSSAVDEEFADVATQVLNRTCAMVNKYRRLLMVEAEVGAQTVGGGSFLTPRSDSLPPRSAPALPPRW